MEELFEKFGGVLFKVAQLFVATGVGTLVDKEGETLGETMDENDIPGGGLVKSTAKATGRFVARHLMNDEIL